MENTGHSRHKRPTLRTIAQMTGLAVATVSRALKDAPDIGVDTKIRVREVADRLGYRPNRAGVRLRTGKTNVIALVMSTEEHVMNHTAQLIHSVSRTLKNTPYHLVITPYGASDDPMDPIRYIVETESADGVIFNQIKLQDPRIEYLLKNNVPFATHGRSYSNEKHPYFDFDNEAFCRIAVEHLVKRGRKKLALLAPPQDQNYARNLITGFSENCELLGVDYSIVENATSDSPVAELQTALRALMSTENCPDGVISSSTSAAMFIVAAAEKVGLTIGKDIDLVAKEALDFLKYFREEIIVVNEDVSKAGTFLVEALIAAIEGPDDIRQGLEVPTGIKN
ncbi:MAG: transcriptional regulator [Hyphomicrobiales bacterium]|nr:MAG: transcriptional regulator [Hyphomicrobiales bacterium]